MSKPQYEDPELNKIYEELIESGADEDCARELIDCAIEDTEDVE